MKVKVIASAIGIFAASAVSMLYINLTSGQTAPSILQQPLSVAVEPGASATFQVTASGAPAYFWKFNGVSIPGANSATLEIPNAKMANIGQYSVTVQNAFGLVTSQVANLRFKKDIFPLNQKQSALYYPYGVAVDPVGTVFVSDMMNKRVVALSKDNKVLRQVSLPKNPGGLVLSGGFVYVNATNNGLVTFNGPIMKFDLNLNSIASYNAPFVANAFTVANSVIYAVVRGQNAVSTVYTYNTKTSAPSWTRLFDFKASEPSAIAINSKGQIYLSGLAPDGNTKTSWVKEFDAQGTVIRQLQLPSTVSSTIPGGVPINYFAGIRALAIDGGNNIFVGDSFGRVLKFNSLGKYLAQIYPESPTSTKLQGTYAVALDSSGNIYVADSRTIKEFSPAGVFITQFGSAGTLPSRLYGPTSLAVAMQDNIYVADQLNGAVKAFNNSGAPIFQIQNDLTYTDGSTTALLTALLPYKVFVGADGSVYVYWTGNYTTIVQGGAPGVSYSGILLRYDLAGKPGGAMFGFTTNDGPFTQDQKGNVLILKPTESKVDLYQLSAGSTSAKATSSVVLMANSKKILFPARSFSGNLGGIQNALKKDARGNYYVFYHDYDVNPSLSRILKFNPQGVLQASMSTQAYEHVGDVAVDSKELIYATCGNPISKVCVFNSDGSTRLSFGSSGIGVGQMWSASGIAIDSMDNILVTDSINNRVTKFGPDGEPLIH